MTVTDNAMIYADYQQGAVTQITVTLPPGATREDVAATVALFLPAPAATVRHPGGDTRIMNWAGSTPLDAPGWDQPQPQYQ